jgi:hypothetical protein
VRVTNMTGMWQFLDTFTYRANGDERDVNHNNEWGGFSRKLGMPVFTAWYDMLDYNKVTKESTAVICDTAWSGRAAGLSNQERWIRFAEEKNDGIAAFFVIHAKSVNAKKRDVQYIDDDKVFVGKLFRRETQTLLTGLPRSL